MPVKPEQFALVQQHLAKFPQQQPCPICGGKTWNVAALESGLLMHDAGVSVGGGIPTVTVVCATCYFVRRFAWMPIARAAGGAGHG